MEVITCVMGRTPRYCGLVTLPPVLMALAYPFWPERYFYLMRIQLLSGMAIFGPFALWVLYEARSYSAKAGQAGGAQEERKSCSHVPCVIITAWVPTESAQRR